MGSSNGHPDERPPHPVYLEAFYIDRFEVSNEQYLQFFESTMGQRRSYTYLDPKTENPDSHIVYQNGRYTVEAGYEQHPVTLVSWYGAQAYCEDRGGRLPTEAEWEKAARGPNGRAYPWGDDLDRTRLNAGWRIGDTTPVGNYPTGTSPYGVHDVAGNVWEWTADWYQPYPASLYDSVFFGEKYKVVRGGSWNHPDWDARTTQRDLAHPARRIHVVGFRCATSP
ncbi:MAG: SUMF1/EgtB/PvdO family nonheme iron enzyme [Anaerolineae bacterium]|nr:SUMF1/EgtB/PvdO family nonheme iron enzyme [Anaerolineae bacterium]